MNFSIICILFLATIQLSRQNNDFIVKLTKSYIDTHPDLRKECMAKVNIDKQVVYNYELTGDIPNDESLGCYFKCIFVGDNMWNEAGGILTENLEKADKVPKHTLDGLMEKCSEFDKVNLCKGALEFAKCQMAYAETHLPK